LIEAAVLPLRDLVVFPRMVAPIFIGRESSLVAVQDAQAKNQTVIGLVQKDPEIEEPKPSDFLPIGIEMAVGRCSRCRMVHRRRWCRDAAASRSWSSRTRGRS